MKELFTGLLQIIFRPQYVEQECEYMKRKSKAPAETKGETTTLDAGVVAGTDAPQELAANGGAMLIGESFTYYDPSIFINAPAFGAVVPGSFTVSGTVSCDLLEDFLGEPGVFLRTANQEITSVQVSLGTAAPVNATPTGPSGTPWTSWTFPVSGRPSGPLTITAEVTASGSAGLTGTDTASRPVTVDANPPTFTINPPADVVQPAPPYIATITGTVADSPAGVAAVEWQFGSSVWQAATGTTNWTAQVPLPGLGLHTVSFRARDNMGNISATQTIQVRVGDFTAPSLSITEPQSGDTFPLVNGQV